MICRGLQALIVIVVAIGCSGVAAAFEASGIWIGKRTCTGFGTDHGKIAIKNLGSTLAIFQAGPHVAIELDGFFRFSAIAIENPKKLGTGHLGIVRCGTSDSFYPFGLHEVGRLTISTKPNGKATIRGTSIQAVAFLSDAVQTCKWSYKRFQVSFPGVAICDSSQPFPTPTPSTTAQCPNRLEVIGMAGANKVLDTGWTGLAHNQTVIQDGKLTFTVSGCDSTVRPCGVCDIGGPIQNVNADAGDINAHRCSNDTSIKCNDDAGCTAPGKCVFYFGSPLPLSAGGVSTCVTNQINGSVSGTANVESGTFASTLNLSSRVFNGIETALPCPVCVGDGTVNDGNKAGTCSGGPKNGQTCDGNGRSPVPSFGTTSFDCPPNTGALITTLSIALDGSTGTETMTLSANSPGCSDAAGKKCFCPSDGQSTRPSACIDTTDFPGDGTLCAADSQTEGHCPEGPVDQQCVIETFRGCLVNLDCPAPGDSCGSGPRLCYLDNGAVGGSVIAIGMTDPPDANGEADPRFAALFCVGKTNAAVNASAGLPGLGRIQLPLHTRLTLAVP